MAEKCNNWVFQCLGVFWGQGEGLREATVEHFRQPYFIWEEKENYLQFQWQPITGLIGAASAWKSVAMATPGGIIKNF